MVIGIDGHRHPIIMAGEHPTAVGVNHTNHAAHGIIDRGDPLGRRSGIEHGHAGPPHGSPIVILDVGADHLGVGAGAFFDRRPAQSIEIALGGESQGRVGAHMLAAHGPETLV